MKKFQLIITAFVFYCCVMRAHSLFNSNKNNCSIINYDDGSNFLKKNDREKISILIANDMKKKLKDLGQLAKQCKVIINVLKSFILETHESKSRVLRNPLYIGRGIEIDLYYKNKTLLCDKKCLSDKANKTSETNCFLSGLDNLKWEKLNTTNLISDKEYEKSKYSDLKAAKQAEFISAECSHVYKLKYGEMTKVPRKGRVTKKSEKAK